MQSGNPGVKPKIRVGAMYQHTATNNIYGYKRIPEENVYKISHAEHSPGVMSRLKCFITYLLYRSGQ